MRSLPLALAFSAAFVVLSLALVGCPPDPRDAQAPEVVAKAGERSVGRLQLLRALTWAGVARNEDAEVRRRLADAVLQQEVEEELLLAAAEQAGVKVPDDDVDRAMARAARGYPTGSFERVLHAEQMTVPSYTERVRRQLTIDRFLAQKVKDPIKVTDAELRARYEQEKGQDSRPAAVRVRQVLVKTEEEAEHVLSEIQRRRLSVEEAARRYSAAPEGQEGGLLPWFSKGELPEVFDVCFALEEGATSGVVASNYGFHIFELVAKRPAGQETFDEARPRLTRELTREKEGAAIRALVAELKKETPVVIEERAFRSVLAQLPPPPEEKEGEAEAVRGPDGRPQGEMEMAEPPPMNGPGGGPAARIVQ